MLEIVNSEAFKNTSPNQATSSSFDPATFLDVSATTPPFRSLDASASIAHVASTIQLLQERAQANEWSIGPASFRLATISLPRPGNRGNQHQALRGSYKQRHTQHVDTSSEIHGQTFPQQPPRKLEERKKPTHPRGFTLEKEVIRKRNETFLNSLLQAMKENKFSVSPQAEALLERYRGMPSPTTPANTSTTTSNINPNTTTISQRKRTSAMQKIMCSYRGQIKPKTKDKSWNTPGKADIVTNKNTRSKKGKGKSCKWIY
jgi:hypothetical protein